MGPIPACFGPPKPCWTPTVTFARPGGGWKLHIGEGFAERILAKGKQLHDEGKYREAMEILNKLVYAEPNNTPAKELLADVFEQIGYQKESASVRNSFLAAAYELRSGMPGGVPVKASGPDMIRGMSTELWLNFLDISMDSRKAEGMKFVINLVTPDNGESYVVEMSNSTLTNIKGHRAKNPDLTVTLNRTDLETVMGGKATFDSLIASGKAKFDGDRKPFDQLRSTLLSFTQDFELIPGTKPAAARVNPVTNPDGLVSRWCGATFVAKAWFALN